MGLAPAGFSGKVIASEAFEWLAAGAMRIADTGKSPCDVLTELLRRMLVTLCKYACTQARTYSRVHLFPCGRSGTVSVVISRQCVTSIQPDIFLYARNRQCCGRLPHVVPFGAGVALGGSCCVSRGGGAAYC